MPVLYRVLCKDYSKCFATFHRAYSQLYVRDVGPYCYGGSVVGNADKPFADRYFCRTSSQLSNDKGSKTEPSTNQIEKVLRHINSEYEIKGGRIELVTPKYHEAALAFFDKTFVRDEPICRSLGLKWSDEFEQWILGYIQQNMSLISLAENTGDIMGLHIASRLEETEDGADTVPVKDLKLQKLFALFKYLDQQACFFEKYKGVKQYEFFAVAVSKSHRGLNIGDKLCLSTLHYLKALEKDPYVIRVTGTSRYSQRFIEKNGFSAIFSLDYKDYIVDGEEVVKNMGEHKTVVMYAKNSD